TKIRLITDVIEMIPSVPERPTAVHLESPVRGHVELNSVSFSYGNGSTVLESLNLKLEAGEKVALVGVSGSGKSTITKLIARLYDVNQGVVRIDGIDVRDVTLASLRSTVCYVPQEAILFDRSIKENLLLGKADASIEELWEAVEVAGLTALIHSLPRGWDTPIGPRGMFLSGGERQRLSIARAVLQKPSVFLLD